jgi:DNA sulfur modification protein DndC
MTGFVESGETWMKPLLDFRNWLKVVRDEPDARMERRRDGTRDPNKRGPFSFETREEILSRVLLTEREVGRQLISDEEIRYIQEVWSREFDHGQSALEIAREHGRYVDPGEVGMSELPTEEQEILDRLIAEHSLQPELIHKLVDLVLYDFSNLNVHGAQKGLKREIRAAIEKAVANEKGADPTS